MLKLFTFLIVCCILIMIYTDEIDSLNVPKLTFVSDNTCYVYMRVSPVEVHEYEGTTK